ncbi:inorganic phosphate cotransporter [Trichonephila clavipes]|nr:inorganic phosphate cotransporter [Trichonephila clavipes]
MIKANWRIAINGVAQELGIRHERAKKMQSSEFSFDAFWKLIKCSNGLGTLMGIASTVASLSTVLIPLITGFLTTHETLAEWHVVFWISLGIVGSSGVVYVLFGTAEVQSWNFTEDKYLVTSDQVNVEAMRNKLYREVLCGKSINRVLGCSTNHVLKDASEAVPHLAAK